MAITFVNSAVFQDASGAGHTSVSTGTFSLTAQNFVVVIVRQDTDTTPPSSVTDTAGNTYTHFLAADSSKGSGDLMTIWYKLGAAGNASNAVTVNWASSHTFISVIARQYNSGGNSIVADVGSNGADIFSGSDTSGTSSSFTTTGTDEVIVVGASSAAATLTFSAGTIGGTTATNVVGDAAAASQQAGSEDLIVTSVQTGITASMSWSPASSGFELSVASFKRALTSSVQDSRVTPNAIRYVEGNRIFDLPPAESRAAGAPVDSRASQFVQGETFQLTAAGTAAAGNTTYTGVFNPPIPANDPVTIQGFNTTANNGAFTVVSCTTASLVVNNPSGVAETHAGTVQNDDLQDADENSRA